MSPVVITVHDYHTDRNQREIADQLMEYHGIDRQTCDRIEYDETHITFRIVLEDGKRIPTRWVEIPIEVEQ